MRSMTRLTPVALCWILAGCGEATVVPPRPFEEVDVRARYSRHAEQDWSSIAPVGSAGIGHPDAPLLPLREEMSVAVTSAIADLNGRIPPSDGAIDSAGNIRLNRWPMTTTDLDRRVIQLLSPNGEILREDEVIDPHWRNVFVARIVATDDDSYVLGSLPTNAENNWATILSPNGPDDSFSTGDLALVGIAGDGGFFALKREICPRIRANADEVISRTTIFWIPFFQDRAIENVADIAGPRLSCSRLGNGTHLPWSPEGSYAFDGQGNAYLHSGLPYRIDVYDSKGTPLRRIERTVTSVLPLELFRRGGAEEEELARIQEHWSFADTLGTLGPMFVSRNGSILVNRPDLEAPHVDTNRWRSLQQISNSDFPRSRYWDLFSPTGDFRGTIELPQDFTPYAITDRSVVGWRRNGAGAEADPRLVRLAWDEAENSSPTAANSVPTGPILLVRRR